MAAKKDVCYLLQSVRDVSCGRYSNWGGLTIYTPDLTDSEMSELVEVLEKESVIS